MGAREEDDLIKSTWTDLSTCQEQQVDTFSGLEFPTSKNYYVREYKEIEVGWNKESKAEKEK